MQDQWKLQEVKEGHLYPEKPTGSVMSFAPFESKGVTDVFLNEPEKYL